MHEEKPKGFVEELQSLSDPVKKRVLIISTILIMLVVVAVWFAYFNGVIASAGQPTIADNGTTIATTTQPVAASGPSIWQNIENGLASIGNIFKGPSNYNIQPK